MLIKEIFDKNAVKLFVNRVKDMTNEITLRPHHLLCILTYIGRGYSEDFILNFNMIIHNMNKGNIARIVVGSDSLCLGWNYKECPRNRSGKCREAVVMNMDHRALISLKKAVDLNISFGSYFSPSSSSVWDMRTAFTGGKIRSACALCEWQDLCTEIAYREYRGVLFRPDIVPPLRAGTVVNQGLYQPIEGLRFLH